MPFRVIEPSDRASDNPEALSDWNGVEPDLRILLWPYRSLAPQGFVWFISLTAGLLTIPLLALLGTAALWALLPFVMATIGAIWFSLTYSHRSAQLLEELCLWPDHMALVRVNPNGDSQVWEANPYWVSTSHRDDPVEHYLTLTGGEREVELGSFLSPDERRQLEDRLNLSLRQIGVPKT